MADLSWERTCWKQGYRRVVGVDEAGRGALAGPIVAAAVVFRPGTRIVGNIALIDDSKQISAQTRNRLADFIKSRAMAWSVAESTAYEIDVLGINRANRLCMERAIDSLAEFPEIALIDAIICESDLPQIGLIDGDARSVSIAAASILAKTTRDAYMQTLHDQHSCYGFNRHVGYGTPQHLAALRQFGPSPHHRVSFGGVLESTSE